MSKISDYFTAHENGTNKNSVVQTTSMNDLVNRKTIVTDLLKDNVNPQHYQAKNGSNLQAIDVIEAFDLGFNLGNVVKYILRCGRKDAPVQELLKAKWYLEREISARQDNSSINAV